MKVMNDMNKEKITEYLKFAKEHYQSLSKLMKIQNKEKYSIEHSGKIKFIDLLILKINNNDFND